MSKRSKRFEDVSPDHGHLVVTREVGESVFIGEGAEQVIVTPVECTPGRVRFGIRAPLDVHILRDNAVRTSPPEHRTSAA